MDFPARTDADRDRMLKGAPRELYAYFTWSLDFDDYRAKTLFQICYEAGLAKRTALFAIRVLVRRGYIERRRPASPNQPTEFRLYRERPDWAPMPSDAAVIADAINRAGAQIAPSQRRSA